MSDNLEYRLLLLAIQEKLRNNERIKNVFADRIFEIDDPDDPNIRGFSTSDPFIGIDDFEVSPTPLPSYQMDEALRIRIWVYAQRVSADARKVLTARNSIVALWQLVVNEMCWRDDRNDFTGTSYDGPQIIEVFFLGSARKERLRNPAHPNLMRKYLDIEYQRTSEVELV